MANARFETLNGMC